MEKFEEREWIELINEGQKMFGVLHRPLGNVITPAVLICHGLAGNKIGMHRMYVSLSEMLAKIGIASLRLDFRGSGDSEGEFSEVTFSGEVSDALVALNYLAKQPNIDAKRLGIYGRSFGGAVAIMTAQKYPSIKSFALWASIFDVKQWEAMWELVRTGQVDEKKGHEMMRINGQLPGLQFYQELFSVDLTSYLKDLSRIPMLHIHGEKDPVVKIDHANKFVEFRKNAESETQFIRLPHSDHDFSHPEEKVLALKETCAWFQKTL